MPPRPALPFLAVLVVPAIASATPDEPTDPIPISPTWWQPEITPDLPPASDTWHEPGVLFINFDGGQMQGCGGSNDPRNNCSTIMQGVVLPWSGGANSRAAVIQMMSTDVEDFALDVVASRPGDDIDYDMVMVGNWDPPAEGGFAGVAPTIDCFNNTRGETAFTLSFQSASLVAKITGQEAAHVWGLEHVDSTSDLLFPTTGGASDPRFEDACHQIVVLEGGISPTDAVCPDMHALNCPGQPNHQNSYQDLMMVFGPRSPDTIAPEIAILAPADGATMPSGTDFDLVLSMQDNVAPQLFDVYVSLDEDKMGQKVGQSGIHWPGPTLTIPVKGLNDGTHFIRVDVADLDENTSTDLVTFVIGMPTGGTTSETATATSETATDSTGSSSSTGESTTETDTDIVETGDTSGEMMDESPQGCACGMMAPQAAWWLALPFTPVLRRRRE